MQGLILNITWWISFTYGTCSFILQYQVKMAPYYFLKSGGKVQISTSKSTMNISEKNETIATH